MGGSSSVDIVKIISLPYQSKLEKLYDKDIVQKTVVFQDLVYKYSGKN